VWQTTPLPCGYCETIHCPTQVMDNRFDRNFQEASSWEKEGLGGSPVPSRPTSRSMPRALDLRLPPKRVVAITGERSIWLTCAALFLLRPQCDQCDPHAVTKCCHSVPGGGHISQSLALFGPWQTKNSDAQPWALCSPAPSAASLPSNQPPIMSAA
jgi:hypothetical protein